MVRQPAVAGRFYPGQGDALKKMMSGFLAEGEKKPALGIVSPHAGYVYSGAIAGEVFGAVQVPDRVVILGPNHHGLGHPAAIYPGGSWLTPLGESIVDEELTAEIRAACPALAADEVAHRLEHSLEVQLPFIQFLTPQATIVPVCLGFIGLEDLVAIGEGLARALAGKKVLMVASSDMTHYESAKSARRKDMCAIERIEALDPEGLFRTVLREKISMCGVVPVVVMLAAARRLGAGAVSLIRYGNSGEITGDQAEVVGYAGLVVR